MAVADYGPDTANCRIFARSNGPSMGFSASGSPKFVGASMVGAAIGAGIVSAIAQNQNYNDCMQARGWRVVEATKPAPSAENLAPQPAAPPTSAPVPLASGPRPATPVAAVPVTTAATASTARSATSLAPAVAPAVPWPGSRRAFLVRVLDVSPESAASMLMQSNGGVLVIDVLAGGAAAASGLRAGDVILAVNGARVSGFEDLTRDLDRIPPGGQAQVSVWRNDGERPVMVRF
jgi:membrane-associated protease RseP (regulator of RpoE activity)